MPKLLLFILLTSIVSASQQLPKNDEIRIVELYSLAIKLEDHVWPDWAKAPFPVLLVTPETEFLIHYPRSPEGFEEVQDSALLLSPIYSRPRKFPTSFLATFPALGDQFSVIVVGQPQSTAAKTSTPWLITLMHEHFHQLQNSQPGYFQDVNNLGLAKGDTTGMWMLNYPFPYESKDLNDSFDRLKSLLLAALNEPDNKKFSAKAKEYVRARRDFLAKLGPDDHKYLGFQLWQEGMARYTEIKFAEAAASYQPSADYKSLPDYSDLASYAREHKSATLKELSEANLAKWKRVVFYSFGSAEGLLLDRLHPRWQIKYFKEKFSTDSYF